MAWSCSHSILLGTAFLLGALLWIYADPLRGAAREDLRTAGALLLAALAAFTHELFCLAPAILAAWIVHRATPRRWIWSGLALAVTAGYITLTWGVHRAHPVQAGTIANLARNFFHYPATFVAPIQRLEILHEWSARIGTGGLAGTVVPALPYLLGSAWWIFIGWAVLRQPERRVTIAAGLILMIPPLFLPQHKGWVEVRHLYPAAAVLSPVAGSALGAAIRRRPFGVAVLAAVWFALLLAGTTLTQHRANQWSRSPGAMRRLEHVRSIRDGGVPAPLPEEGIGSPTGLEAPPDRAPPE